MRRHLRWHITPTRHEPWWGCAGSNNILIEGDWGRRTLGHSGTTELDLTLFSMRNVSLCGIVSHEYASINVGWEKYFEHLHVYVSSCSGKKYTIVCAPSDLLQCTVGIFFEFCFQKDIFVKEPSMKIARRRRIFGGFGVQKYKFINKSSTSEVQNFQKFLIKYLN